MVILGLVLVAAGGVIVLLGLFTSDVNVDHGETTVEVANIDLTPAGVFLAGVIAAALILAGLWAIKLGAKQGLRRRKEQRQLEELSEKLGRAEAERHRDDDEDNDHRS